MESLCSLVGYEDKHFQHLRRALPLFCCIWPSQHLHLFCFWQSNVPWLEQKSSSIFSLPCVQLVPPGGVNVSRTLFTFPWVPTQGGKSQALPTQGTRFISLWAQLQFIGSSHSPSLRIKSWSRGSWWVQGQGIFSSLAHLSICPCSVCWVSSLCSQIFPVKIPLSSLSTHSPHPIPSILCEQCSASLFWSSTWPFAVAARVPGFGGWSLPAVPCACPSLLLSGPHLPQPAHLVVIIKSPLHQAGLGSAEEPSLSLVMMLWSPASPTMPGTTYLFPRSSSSSCQMLMKCFSCWNNLCPVQTRGHSLEMGINIHNYS